MEKEQNLTNQGNKITKEYGRDRLENGDLVMYEGQLHRAVKHDTGYTVREYYSHSTPEKGPGPGWDFHQSALKKYGVKEPSELPNQPYFTLELKLIDDIK